MTISLFLYALFGSGCCRSKRNRVDGNEKAAHFPVSSLQKHFIYKNTLGFLPQNLLFISVRHYNPFRSMAHPMSIYLRHQQEL